MKPKIIGNESYNILKSTGHVVPRNKQNYIVESFKVGGEYEVKSEENEELIKVRCTQDCPHHLKIIEE